MAGIRAGLVDRCDARGDDGQCVGVAGDGEIGNEVSFFNERAGTDRAAGNRK
jgi:hypothetical protein